MVARSPARTLALLGCVTALALVLHIGIGSYEWFTPAQVVGEILKGPQANSTPINSIIWDTRLPRAVMCLLVGGLLGVVGSAFQALLRNPLADPYIVGVSSGAAVGGAIAVVLGWGTALFGLGVDVSGFLTGMAALAFVYTIAKRRGVVDVRTLLLAGVVSGSLFSALLSLVLLSGGRDTNDVLRWLLGSTNLASWPKIAVLSVALVGGTVILFRQSRQLNAFAFGAGTAQRLGVDVPRLTRVILISGAAMTAVCVGAVGIIGFLGLVAPHIARRVMGVDWRWSLLGSLGFGAVLLLASDLFAQRGMSMLTHTVGMDIPVGIVTSVFGAPTLLFLLRKSG